MKPIPETREVLDELVGQGDTDLVALVLRMGRGAKQIVPECVGLSLTLLEDDLTLTLVATDDELAALDAVQYLDGGPCVEAAHESEVVTTQYAEILAESDWHLYALASAAAGVASSLTLPILRSDRAIGSVNLYAATSYAFDGRHQALASELGASAESAITNADLSFSSRMAAVEAPARLADQTDIDIALGIIVGSQHVDVPEAEQRLRQAAARAGVSEGQAARVLRQILPS